MNSQTTLALRGQAMAVECPYCRRPVGEPCLNRITGDDLQYGPAHTQRLKAAGL